MSGAKGSKLAARGGKVGPRKHHCPECREETISTLFCSPKKRMAFQCKAGHITRRGRTILL